MEPFGGLDNFDVSETHIVYTAKDPKLPLAWHTKQNVQLAQAETFCEALLIVLKVYLVDIAGGAPPKELTSGKQGKRPPESANMHMCP